AGVLHGIGAARVGAEVDGAEAGVDDADGAAAEGNVLVRAAADPVGGDVVGEHEAGLVADVADGGDAAAVLGDGAQVAVAVDPVDAAVVDGDGGRVLACAERDQGRASSAAAATTSTSTSGAAIRGAAARAAAAPR